LIHILKHGTIDALLQFQSLTYVRVEHLLDQQFQILRFWRKHSSIVSSEMSGRFSPGGGTTSFRAIPAIDVEPEACVNVPFGFEPFSAFKHEMQNLPL
jgi:hypothetical protein